MALKVAKISTGLGDAESLATRFQALLDDNSLTLDEIFVEAYGDNHEVGFVIIYDDTGVAIPTPLSSSGGIYAFQFVFPNASSAGWYLQPPGLFGSSETVSYALISDMRLVGFSLTQTNAAYDGLQQLRVKYDSAPDSTAIPALCTLDVTNAAAAVLTIIGIDLTVDLGIVNGNSIRIVSPDGTIVSAITVTTVSTTATPNDTITYNHTTTPIKDLLGADYTVGTDDTFGADYDNGGAILTCEVMTIIPDASAIAWTAKEDTGDQIIPYPAIALKTDSDKIGLRVLVQDTDDLDPSLNPMSDINLILYFKRTA